MEHCITDRGAHPPYPQFSFYTQARLAEISALADGWDGEAAQAVTGAALAAMQDVLTAVADEQTVFPFLTPSGDGNVVAEWHAGAQSVIIEAGADGAVTADIIGEDGQRVLSGLYAEEHTATLRTTLAGLTDRVVAANPQWREMFIRPLP